MFTSFSNTNFRTKVAAAIYSLSTIRRFNGFSYFLASILASSEQAVGHIFPKPSFASSPKCLVLLRTQNALFFFLHTRWKLLKCVTSCGDFLIFQSNSSLRLFMIFLKGETLYKYLLWEILAHDIKIFFIFHYCNWKL